MAELAKWESFFSMVGSAAAALIGLQFVVITLIAQRPSLRVAEAGAAFSTPTIIHFGAALLISALMQVPWQAIVSAAVLWEIIGVAGAGYALVVHRRMRRQKAYQPEFEDWLFYWMLPFAAYVLLAAAGAMVVSFVHEALFGVGAAALILLFVGIHNSWDSITYHVFTRRHDDPS